MALTINEFFKIRDIAIERELVKLEGKGLNAGMFRARMREASGEEYYPQWKEVKNADILIGLVIAVAAKSYAHGIKDGEVDRSWKEVEAIVNQG